MSASAIEVKLTRRDFVVFVLAIVFGWTTTAWSLYLDHKLWQEVAHVNRAEARPVVQVPNRGYTRSEIVEYEYKVREYKGGCPLSLEEWLREQSKGGWRQVAGTPYLPRFEWERQVRKL